MLTIEDLLPADWDAIEFEAFEPCAGYSHAMDCIIYLREDHAYRADRIDQFLTILWHPHDDRVIGVKIKGMRFLFEGLKSVLKKSLNRDLSDEKFVGLVGALEFALKVREGAALSDRLEKNRAEDWAALNRNYELAMGIVESVTFDVSELKAVAH